jgi:hypothetical protein
MLISLDNHDAEILALTLRFWRSQRLNSTMRKRDPAITAETIDLLLTKLGAVSLQPTPPDQPLDSLR